MACAISLETIRAVADNGVRREESNMNGQHEVMRKACDASLGMISCSHSFQRSDHSLFLPSVKSSKPLGYA